MASTNPRAQAAQCVDAVLHDGQSLDRALDKVHGPQQPFIAHLSYTTLRWATRLQWFSDHLLNRPLRRRDHLLGTLLLVGLGQLRDDDAADHAAVNETVQAASALKFGHAKGLVNAVLRNYQRRQGALLEKLEQADPSIKLAHPPWWIERLRADWPGHWQEIAAANNSRAAMWLRVNLARTRREDYRQSLSQAGLDTVAPSQADPPSALALVDPVNVVDLPGFAEGLVSVQDVSAQWAATLLAPQAGERVLDACAAPGGKTLHLLECAHGNLDLTAIDSDSHRLDMVTDNLRRADYTATCLTADASQPGTWSNAAGEGGFDAILLDAPCTGSGVIRRHPDIKHLRRPQDISKLAQRQWEMMSALAPLLRPGGRMLYATCSVLNEENSAHWNRVVDASEQLGLILEAFDLPASQADAHGGRYLLPQAHEPDQTSNQTHPGGDGFYYGLLRKKT